jgi:GH15 family glucan-1,4-alpha-glucosidase
MSQLQLADYAIIGNQSSVALVSRLGSIDWCCFPYMDSPSHFGSILDENHGGRFQLMPVGDFRAEQKYLQRTHVLETVFETPHGRAALIDWMPMDEQLKQDPVIFRRIEVIDGKIAWQLNCSPRFGYGAHQAHAEKHRGGILFRGATPDEVAGLRADVPLEISQRSDSGGGSPGGLVTARFTLEAGQNAHFTWAWGRRAHLPETPSPAATIAYWRGWAHRCGNMIGGEGTVAATANPDTGAPSPLAPPAPCIFAGPWHDTVTRSALVLKLLTSAHSGAIAEAATTSIPGISGTSRNWDYRYAWIRDGAMAIQALAHLGYREESTEFFLWLSDIIARDGAEGLQPVYLLDGGRHLPERELSFLAGYQGSRPVRIGNHSSRQFQLDIYGHILIAATEFHGLFGELPEGLWDRLVEIADHVCQAWRRPDHGPWETRAKPEHYVGSKVMCWVALDRAIQLAREVNFEIPTRWHEEKKILHHTICLQGFDKVQMTFVRSFGSRDLDASALLIPMLGFLPFDDPRVQGTLAALQEHLSEGIVLHRYRTVDGLPGLDGVHLVTSFLFCSCLALAGRVQEASDRLAELCTYATGMGIFGEQINLDAGETTGNFPSAAVHMALINAALYVGAARARGAHGASTSPVGLTRSLIGMPEREKAVGPIPLKDLKKGLFSRRTPWNIRPNDSGGESGSGSAAS